MYVNERTLEELGFDYEVAKLFAQGEVLNRKPVKTLAYASEYLSYEMNDAALLELDNGSFIIIHATSCSCWPSMGGADIYEGTDAMEMLESFKKEDKYLGEELISKYRSW